MSGEDPYAPGQYRPGYQQPAPLTQVTGQQPPGSGSYWDGPGDPAPRGRGRTVAIIAALGVVALLAGIGAGLLGTRGGDTTITASPAETATRAAGTTAPVAAATSTAAATTAGSGPTPSSGPKGFAPLPEHPETAGADFGFVVSVSGGPKHLRIVFDRAQFLTGDAAKKANGGQSPPDDYVIENQNTMKRSFAIDPRAALIGTARLNNENGVVKREALTAGVFLDNLRDALAADGKVAVWLRHTNGLDGTVTAVSEQYLP